MKKILLIDGNSMINRAFYGMSHARHLSNREGKATGAVYTFMTIFLSVWEGDEYDGLACCFDRKEKTFRHKMYDGYKATRTGMPEELYEQLLLLKELLAALEIPCYELAGYEADDLIGTLATAAAGAGIFCDILSGDRDDFQLLGSYVSQIYPGKNGRVRITAESLPEHYLGMCPSQIVDLKAIMGDSSDCIPGVKGLGEKAAVKLLSEYRDLDEIYAHLEDIKGAQRKKLEEGREAAYLSRRLATIDCHAPLEYRLEELSFEGIGGAAAAEALRRFSFDSLIRRLGLEGEKKEKTLREEKQLYLRKTAQFWPRLETKLRARRENTATEDELLLFLAPCENGILAAFSAEEEAELFWISEEERDDFLRKTEAEKKLRLCCYHLKPKLKAWSYFVDRPYFDPKIASYLLGHALKEERAADLVREEQSLPVFRIAAAGGSCDREEVELLTAAEELGATELLTRRFRAEIEERGAEMLAYEIEMPLIVLLAEMEERGIEVDPRVLTDLERDFSEKLRELETRIYERVGHPFNLLSPQQLSQVLFEELGLKHGKKSSNGFYSTAASVLEELAEEEEVVAQILEYRKISKLLSTFVTGLKNGLREDRRVHSNFHQDLTNTGRLSSSDPNLQNIPNRSEEGRLIRAAFVAGEGKCLLDADYSQIELRLLAEMAGDEAMIEAFRARRDIHEETARALFAGEGREISRFERSQAKVVNFSVVYGVSEFGLAKNLSISMAAARRYIDQFYRRHPQIRTFMDESLRSARERGYVETVFLRRRYTPEVKQGNFNQRKAAERAAMNMPIQGTAADLMKHAMVRAWRSFRREGIEAAILLQVHDELLVEVSETEAERAKTLLTEAMEGAMRSSVPLSVEAAAAANWAEAH